MGASSCPGWGLSVVLCMQALFEFGEEKGTHPGLNLLPGRVIRFPDFEDRKVPHTGWNQLWTQKESALFKGIAPGSYAYFNHSYYCAPTNQEDISTLTDYGIDFASTVESQNIYGVQFHPEKSQRVGQTLLRNFFKA
jgi:glutamine amidotransferase